jgi:hypothetical protein
MSTSSQQHVALPSPDIKPMLRSRLNALFTQAITPDANPTHLENALLALALEHPDFDVAQYCIEALKNEAVPPAVAQLACMGLIRQGEKAKKAVLQFATTADTERDVWVAHFLMHQLGLNR